MNMIKIMGSLILMLLISMNANAIRSVMGGGGDNNSSPPYLEAPKESLDNAAGGPVYGTLNNGTLNSAAIVNKEVRSSSTLEPGDKVEINNKPYSVTGVADEPNKVKRVYLQSE